MGCAAPENGHSHAYSGHQIRAACQLPVQVPTACKYWVLLRSLWVTLRVLIIWFGWQRRTGRDMLPNLKSLCGSVSLGAINFNANLRKIHPGTSTQLNSSRFDLHIRAPAFQFSWRSVYRISIYKLSKAQKCVILHTFLAWNQNGTLITGADTDCVHVMHVGTPSMGHAAWFVGRV